VTVFICGPSRAERALGAFSTLAEIGPTDRAGFRSAPLKYESSVGQ
jgi:hypothetical protein